MFAAGDPGGANALRPVIGALVERGRAVAVVNHGGLAQDLPRSVQLVESVPDAEVLCIGTSLTDTIPLTLARQFRQQGGRVAVVLDNWVNYRSRLATDGLPPFIPDIYAVMDHKAFDEAVADGIPPSCLVVTGHPNLASLAVDADNFDRQGVRQAVGLGLNGRELAVFVNEPVSADQGTGPDNPLWRGYTEQDALAALAAAVDDAAIDVAIVPHPRDDLGHLETVWARKGGRCSGRVVTGFKGRDLVLAADRTAGMASILLYESWLLGRPTISLQPGLVREDLLSIASRPGMVLMRERSLDPVRHWLTLPSGAKQPDLHLHAQAAQRIADLLTA